MPKVVAAATRSARVFPGRRPPRPAYGVLIGPFVAGVAITLLLAAGTRQPITVTWMMASFLVGGVAAALALASTMWRHEPHVVAGLRARHAPGPSLEPDDYDIVAPAPQLEPGHAEPVAAAGPEPERSSSEVPLPERANDPLAHIHAVENQGRRLRRNCVNCGTPVPLKDAACPSCGQPQVYQCKGCKTPIRLDWTQCPECGREVH